MFCHYELHRKELREYIHLQVFPRSTLVLKEWHETFVEAVRGTGATQVDVFDAERLAMLTPALKLSQARSFLAAVATGMSLHGIGGAISDRVRRV